MIVIDLARRKKLRLEYLLLWTLTSMMILALVFWYQPLLIITRWIEAVLLTTTLFIFGLMFLLFLNLHFSVKLSQLAEQMRNLGQESALHQIHKPPEQAKQEPEHI